MQPPSRSRLVLCHTGTPGLYQQSTDEEQGPERAGGWPKVTQDTNGMIPGDPCHPNSQLITHSYSRDEGKELHILAQTPHLPQHT